MKKFFITLSVFFTLFYCGVSNAQVSVGPGVVNAYYKVTSVSGATINYSGSAGVSHSLAPGDMVMIIQMTGSTLGNGGKFEFGEVTSASGGSVTIKPPGSGYKGVLNRQYTPGSEDVQLVWVPGGKNKSITMNGDIEALPYQNGMGGIVSLWSDQYIEMNGSISADGAGFEYGQETISGKVYHGGGGGGSMATIPGELSGEYAGGGGGGGYGSGGHKGMGKAPGEDGTFNGGAPGPADEVVGSGGAGGGAGAGAAGGGGAGTYHGGGGGGGASYGVGGNGGKASCGDNGCDIQGGPGHQGGSGDGKGQDGNDGTGVQRLTPVGVEPIVYEGYADGGGGGGGGRYVGGGGGGGSTAGGKYSESGNDPSIAGSGGHGGSSGGTGGHNSSAGFDGGDGGGTYNSYTNYQYCTPTGQCNDVRAWMGGGGGWDNKFGSSKKARGGGIVMIYGEAFKLNGTLEVTAHGEDADDRLGGGGGGMVALNTHKILGGTVDICARGGKGGTGKFTFHGGGSGGGGGGGLAWVYDLLGRTDDNQTGFPPAVKDMNFCPEVFNGGALTPNPKNSSWSGGGGPGGDTYKGEGNNCEVFGACGCRLKVWPWGYDVGECDKYTNEYKVTGTMDFSEMPTTGLLVIRLDTTDSVTYNVPSSPDPYSYQDVPFELAGLQSDGLPHKIYFYFTDSLSCADTIEITAPEPCAMDLALRKVPMQKYVQAGADMKFKLEIFNQGFMKADDIQITDYMPSGYDFIVANNPGWTDLGGGKLQYTVTDRMVNPGDSMSLIITLRARHDAVHGVYDNHGQFINEAEVSEVKSEWGRVIVDLDSWHDDDPDNDNPVTPGDPNDDKIDGQARKVPGDDEDDNDVADVKVFDLALVKKETSQGPYRYGDIVEFTFDVINQGEIDAKNIELTDYVPIGFMYYADLNTAADVGFTWTQQSGIYDPKVTIPSLNKYDRTTLKIRLVPVPIDTADSADWTNRAEISHAEDPDGVNMAVLDWDSKFNTDPDDDNGGVADGQSDNYEDGDGRLDGASGDDNKDKDEDDADPARVKIYDLALRKRVLELPPTPRPYKYYENVKFEITVFNQGNEKMTDIWINDYIPKGFGFVAGTPDNNKWVYNATDSTARRSISSIASGDSAKIQIDLKILQTQGGYDDWTNYGEVASMKDDNGTVADTWDADSKPNTDAEHERNVWAYRPYHKNVVDSLNLRDTTRRYSSKYDDTIHHHHFVGPEYHRYDVDIIDEDDHDPASIDVYDLAIKKYLDSLPPYEYGKFYDFNIVVYNQGNIVARDIEVTDYVAPGYSFLGDLGWHWNDDWKYAKRVIPGPLLPGDSDTITITLQFQYAPNRGDYINRVEVSKTRYEQDDIDSTPDDDITNDNRVVPGNPEDDHVDDDGRDSDGDGVKDEDDFDIWGTCVVSIGDTVWYDDNDNGIQDDSESGVKGANVNLYMSTRDGSTRFHVIQDLKTNENGYYLIENLIPGCYTLEINDLPKGAVFAKLNEGADDEKDNDFDKNGKMVVSASGTDTVRYICLGCNLSQVDTNNLSDPLDVYGSQDTFPDWDAGILRLSSIGDTVWLDVDGDGRQDANEPGVKDIKVCLDSINSSGNRVEVRCDSTDNQGRYLFDSLPPGDYVVRFEKPDNLDFTEKRVDNDPQDENDSNANPNGDSDTITLGHNDHRWDIDAGLKCKLDVKLNPLDTLVCGVSTDSVVIKANVSYATPTVKYLWSPGEYPDEDSSIIVRDFSSPQTYKLTVTDKYGCKDSAQAVIRLAEVAHIGDYVWYDKNLNGKQGDNQSDPKHNEFGINGVVVNLWKENVEADSFELEDTDTTDFYSGNNGNYAKKAGYYNFEVCAGDYFLEFIKPDGYHMFTKKDEGQDEKDDSDVDSITGRTDTFSVAGGDTTYAHTIDAGLYKLGSLGNRVWEDENGDGIQNPGETGLNHIKVVLSNKGGPIKTTYTDTNPEDGEDGYYKFDSLPPGKYTVCFFIDSTEYNFTQKVNNNEKPTFSDEDSDVGSTTHTVGDSLRGCTDTIEVFSEDAIKTVDAGLYEYACLGDYVWLDTLKQGYQDPLDEVRGFEGVVVELYEDVDSNGVIPSVAIPLKKDTTDSDGYYRFDKLKPGNYTVHFGGVEGYKRSVRNVRNDAVDDKDSDANVGSGNIDTTIVLSSGECDTTIDAGYYIPASLGDKVWYDKDGDGKQDGNESGVGDVTVILYKDGDSIGVTKTDGNGIYKFDGLFPGGGYKVKFVNPDPNTYVFTEPNVAHDTLDSDAGEDGFSHEISLSPGGNDKTIDAGIYEGVCLEGWYWSEKIGVEGNQLNGLYDKGKDSLVNGMEVRLYKINTLGDGVYYKSAITGEKEPEEDNKGRFYFGNIPKGKYYYETTIRPDERLVDKGVSGGINSSFEDKGDGIARSDTFSVSAIPPEPGKCQGEYNIGVTDQETLPVELIQFTATWNASEKVVELAWGTMNEYNLSHFEVYRRAENEDEFENRLDVRAVGGVELEYYGLIDTDVESGLRYYYRIVPVDLDGQERAKYDASVLVLGEEFKVKAYPNPVTNNLYVVISGERTSDLTVQLLDNLGRKVMDEIEIGVNDNYYEKVQLDMSSLPQGNYYVKVVSGAKVELYKVVHTR